MVWPVAGWITVRETIAATLCSKWCGKVLGLSGGAGQCLHYNLQ